MSPKQILSALDGTNWKLTLVPKSGLKRTSKVKFTAVAASGDGCQVFSSSEPHELPRSAVYNLLSDMFVVGAISEEIHKTALVRLEYLLQTI